jgi:hypothetical protein
MVKTTKSVNNLISTTFVKNLDDKKIINNFEEKESYLHKYAKELLFKWLDESEELLSFSKSNLHMEYPICINNKINSWGYEWWQYKDNDVDNANNDDDVDINFNYVPTYKECVEVHNCKPIAIIDIVCTHKGINYIAVEVVHKSPISQKKLKN